MKYCSKCGNQLMDEAVLCPACGCMVEGSRQPMNQPVQSRRREESPALANAALGLAVLAPIVGLILGIISAAKYSDPELAKKGKAAILVSIGLMIALFSIIVAMTIAGS